MNTTRKLNTSRIILCIVLLFFVVFTASIFNRINTINDRVISLETQLAEKEKAETEILAHLKEIRVQQEQLKRISQEKLDLEKKHNRAVDTLVSRGFDRYTDIGANIELTAADMDRIIDDWNGHVKNGTRFKGKGATFVAAAKESGLNPIYIFAHAAAESAWGKSTLAMNRNNFFGINAYDANPNAAYHMGDNIDDGIIQGAVWIRKNFYDKGYTTLDSMKGANYATDPNWEANIENIADRSTGLLIN